VSRGFHQNFTNWFLLKQVNVESRKRGRRIAHRC